MAHTTCGSEKPTEESTRERGLGVGLGRDSRYGFFFEDENTNRGHTLHDTPHHGGTVYRDLRYGLS